MKKRFCRYLSVVMVFVMVLQVVIPGMGVPPRVVYTGSEELSIDCLKTTFADLDMVAPYNGVNPFSKFNVNFALNSSGQIDVRFDVIVNDNFISEVIGNNFWHNIIDIGDSVPIISFDLNLSNDYFKMISGVNYSQLVTSDDGTPLGEYSIDDSNDSYVLSCKLYKDIYLEAGYTGIKAGRSFLFDTVEDRDVIDANFSLDNNGNLVATINYEPEPDVPHPASDNYTLTKKASSNFVSSIEFSYTITAESTGNNILNDMIISDNLPNGLTLLNATANYFGVEYEEPTEVTTEEETTEDITQALFKFTQPNKTENLEQEDSSHELEQDTSQDITEESTEDTLDTTSESTLPDEQETSENDSSEDNSNIEIQSFGLFNFDSLEQTQDSSENNTQEDTQESEQNDTRDNESDDLQNIEQDSTQDDIEDTLSDDLQDTTEDISPSNFMVKFGLFALEELDLLDEIDVPLDTIDIQVDNSEPTNQFNHIIDSSMGYVRKVEITLNVILSESAYEEHMGGTTEFVFKNSCELLSEKWADNPYKSNTVTTTMNLPKFLNKKGEIVGFDGFKYKWTIDANTYFNYAANVYIVDYISNISVHNYNSSESILLNNVTKGIKIITTPTLPIPYVDIDNRSTSIDYLNDLFSGDNAGEKCLTYTDGNSAVMILKLDTNDLNQPISLNYYTEVNRETGNNEKVENVAKIVWDTIEYKGGYGNGITWKPLYGNAEIEKNGGTANTRVLSKTAGNYNEKTQIMTWNFELNRSGENLTNVKVIDTIVKGEQEFIDTAITAKKYIRSTGAPDGTINLIPTINEDETELTLDFGTVNNDDYFSFSIRTKVTNPNILTKQGANKATGTITPALKNNATITATEITDSQINKISAEKNLNNTLILKECISDYNYTDNSITWEVKINPNKLPIDDAVLTDTLPTGTVFGELLSIKKNNTDIAILDINNYGFTLNNDNTVFNFGNNLTNAEYIIQYTTKYTEDYRLNNFLPTVEIEAINTATLTGTFVNDDANEPTFTKDINVSDSANCKFTPEPLTKTGVYNNYTGYTKYGYDDNRASYITWNVVLNRNEADFSDVTITDDLEDHFYLITESMKIYKIVSFNADGSVNSKNDCTDELKTNFSLLNSTTFTYKIPDTAPNHSAYLFEFDTLITDDASKEEMKNSIELKYKNGNTKFINNGEITGVSGFSFAEYSAGSKAPYLQIYKTSTNTTYTGSLPDTRLAGATFELYEMKYNGTLWKAIDSPPKVKTTDTSRNPINFLMLKKNTLYKLVETVAPVGYKLTDPIYFIFDKNVINTLPSDTNEFITPSSGSTGVIYSVEDEPHDGANDIVFYKHTEKDIPLNGVTFTLTGTGLNPMTATSGDDDNDGMVIFKHVDPGEYKITETPFSNFNTITPITVIVTKSADGSSSEFEFQGYTKDTSGDYIVKNTYARGGITINKSHDNNGTPLAGTKVSGAVYKVFTASDDIPVAYLTETTANSGIYNKLSQTLSSYSNIDGVTITTGDLAGASYFNDGKLLLGDYYAIEITVPNGYGLITEGSTAKKYPINLTSTTGATINTTNKWLGGTVSGKVKKANGNGLEDVWIGIFPKGTTEFTTANLLNNTEQTGTYNETSNSYDEVTVVASVRTDNDGSYSFTGLPYGEYIVAQITDKTLPTYYNPNTTTHNVTITNTAQSITSKDFTQEFQYRPLELNLYAYNENLPTNEDKYLIEDTNNEVQFEVQVNGTPVAYLNYDGTNYKLSNKDRNNSNELTETNGTKPYLYKMADATPTPDQRFYLLEGTYTIVQKSTHTDYRIPVDIDCVEITDYNITMVTTTTNEAQTIDVLNVFSKGTITGTFLNDDNNPISDAWIGLFRPDETVFTENNLYTNIPAVGVTGGYIILDESDVAKQTDGSGYEFTNLPPGEYKVAEIVPNSKYPSASGYGYGGGYSDTLVITIDYPNVTIVAIKPHSRYKEVELTLTAFDPATNGDKTSFDNSIFGVYVGNNLVATLKKSLTGDTYILDDELDGNPIVAKDENNLPYLEYLTTKSMFRLLDGDYSIVQITTDDGYIAPCNADGSAYRHNLTVPDNNDVTIEITNYWIQGTVEGSVISRRDNSELLEDIPIGIFSTGTADYLSTSLCNVINIDGDKYISINARMESTPTGGYSFTGLPLGDYEVAVISDLAKLKGYYTDPNTITTQINATNTDIDLTTTPLEPESMYQTVALELSAFNLSVASTDKDNPLPLEGAEFIIQTPTGLNVAYLIDKGNGEYILSNTSQVTGDTIDETVSEDLPLPYLITVGSNLQLISGDYNVYQTTTVAGYSALMTSGKPISYPFSLGLDNTTGLVNSKDLEAENAWSDGNISGEILKTNGYPIEGTWIGIFPAGTTDFSATNLCNTIDFTTITGDVTSIELNTFAVQTNSQGIYTFPNLPAGDYIIAEIVPDSTYPTVTGYHAGTFSSISVTIEDDDVNDYSGENASIQLSKYGLVELELVSKDDNTISLPEAEFIIKNSLGVPIGYLIDDKNGKYTISNVNSNGENQINATTATGEPYLMKDSDDGLWRILEGTEYYAEQFVTPNRYLSILSDNSLDTGQSTASKTKYFLNAIADNINNQPLSALDPALNVWAPGEVSGTAVSNTGATLGGATIGLFPAGTTDFSPENAFVPVQQTEADGSFSFTTLPLGDYIIAVVEAPSGYTDIGKTFEISVESLDPTPWEEIIEFTKSPTNPGGGSGGSGGSGGGGSLPPLVEDTKNNDGSLTIQLIDSTGDTSDYTAKIISSDSEETVKINPDGTVTLKVPYGDYTIELLDKSGKVITTKKVKVNKPSNNVELYSDDKESTDSKDNESKDKDKDTTDTKNNNNKDNNKNNNNTNKNQNNSNKSNSNKDIDIDSDNSETNRNNSGTGIGKGSDLSLSKNQNKGNDLSLNKTPKTGDNTIPTYVLLIIMALSIIGIGIITIYLKKSKK